MESGEETTQEKYLITQDIDCAIQVDSRLTIKQRFYKFAMYLWKGVGNILSNIFECTAFFILLYLIGWIINALYKDIHFDLTSLQNFYLSVIAKQGADHTINSIWNSPKGKMPNE
jgi:hypothetical protein